MNIKLSIGTLDYKNPTYLKHSTTWKEVEELYQGGSVLFNNIEHYIPRRPGELVNHYRMRLQKTTYFPLLTKSINTMVNKMATGDLVVSNSDDPFWVDFRSNIDMDGMNDDEFVNDVFRELLLYGSYFVHIDKPVSQYQPRNLKEEKELGLRPYLTTYNAREVLDWEKDKGGVNFIKVKQEHLYRVSPFSVPLTKIKWSYITKEYIVIYEVLVKKDSYGNIECIVDERGKEVSPYDDEVELVPTSVIKHGYGMCPVRMLELNPELWVVGSSILKIKECFLLENIIHDTTTIGTPITRSFKPYTVDKDKANVFTEEDGSTIRLGNDTVIKVDEFKYNEMSGSGIMAAQSILTIKQQELAVLLTMKDIKIDGENYEASGNSKRLDFVDQEAALVAFGKIIREFYQEILNIVAKVQNIKNVPSVNGLINFQLDEVSELLLISQGLMMYEKYVPEMTIKGFSKRLSKFILSTNDADVLAKLDAEIEAMDFSNVETDISPNNSLDPNQMSKPKRNLT